MIKKYSIALLVLAISTFAFIAQAQGRPADVRGNVRTNIRANAPTSTKATSTPRGRASATLTELKKERIRKHARQMIAVLRATAERIEKIGNKLETRIRKFESRGAALSLAKAHLAESRIKLAEARALLGAIPALVEEALKGPDPKIAFKTVQDKIELARNAVRSAHEHLILATAAVKFGLNSRNGSNGTTTPPTATTTSI